MGAQDVVRVTVVHEETGNIASFELDGNETIDNVKALIEVELKLPHAQQALLHQGKEITNDASTINQNGIKDQDLLSLRRKAVRQAPQPQQQSYGGAQSYGGGGGGSQGQSQMMQVIAGLFAGVKDLNALTAKQAQQVFRSNSYVSQMLAQGNPALAQAIWSESDSLMQRFMDPLKAEIKTHRMYERLATDPFDVEAQKYLEDHIKQQNVLENYENAMEHTPESFSSVIMLYVDAQVNKVPLKCFVDSGAQMTIMSKKCAEKCGLMRLMDSRWSGIAKGVGTAKILGRIHLTQLQLGKSFFPVSITVLDQDGMEFLLGLDMLRRHQACIDLKDNVLRMGDEVIPFLSEKDIPKEVMLGGERTPTSPNPSSLPSWAPQSSSSSSSAQRPQPQQQQPQQAQGTAPKPQQQASLPQGVTEEKIQQLSSLGFKRAEAIEALTIAGGNVDAAASYLFSM